jgi:hypothetical protein
MHDTEICNDNKELTDQNKEIPDHMQLPSLEEILKMQQTQEHATRCSPSLWSTLLE